MKPRTRALSTRPACEVYHRIEGSFKSFSDGSGRIGVDDVTGPHWLTIGEACRVLGISRTTLLAAEDAALIAPARTPGGHRRYPADEVWALLRRSEAGE